MSLLKRSIFLFGIAAILVASVWQATTVIHFYVNQDSIEKEFCENLDKPEMNCHGHCHLKKKLKINYLVDINVPRESSPKLGILLFQSFEELNEIEIFEPSQENQTTFFIEKHKGTLFSNSLLDPPEFA